MSKQRSFYEVVSDAIRDFTEYGFDSEERLEKWTEAIRKTAERTAESAAFTEKLLRDSLRKMYERLIERGEIVKHHPGISRFTIKKLKPELHAELQRRIMASAQLIKLNRKKAIDQTLSRFSGWATSLPRDGSKTQNKREVSEELRKSLTSLPFEVRRVLIDQGHKFNSSLNNIIATDGGAIAAIWHSHWRQAGYDYREDHKERDGEVYLIRNSWAHERGLVKAGKAGFSDKITQPGEEIFCKCYFTYLYNLRDLPKDMITAKGQEALKEARAQIRDAKNLTYQGEFPLRAE